jgi:hypothetical protein
MQHNLVLRFARFLEGKGLSREILCKVFSQERKMSSYTLLIPGLGSSRKALDKIRGFLAERCTGFVDVFDYDSRGALDVGNFILNQASRIATWFPASKRAKRMTAKLEEIIGYPAVKIHIIAHSHGALLLYRILQVLAIKSGKVLNLENISIDTFGPAKLIPRVCPYFRLNMAVNHFHPRDWILKTHSKLQTQFKLSSQLPGQVRYVDSAKIEYVINFLTAYNTNGFAHAHQSYFDQLIWDSIGSCSI